MFRPDSTDFPEAPLDVLVVGAGFSGLCLAFRLRQAGLAYRVVEQSPGLGGTWYDNRYPGAACDVPSTLYCYSFAANPDWSRSYPRQAEIEAYLNRCADRFGVRGGLHFNRRVEAARYDEARRLWLVALEGHARPVAARLLIVASGGLSRPRMPDIPGLDDFAGRAFHSARWPEGFDLAGKRVGIVGTGASAIQIVPAIVDTVGHLNVFQRTPPWIVPKPDFAVPPRRREAYRRQPWRQRLNRWFTYWRHEIWALGFTRLPWLLKTIQPLAALYRRLQVPDPALRARLKPDYTIGCKRVLLSNDYYPALTRRHVVLTTEAIERIVPEGIRTVDGRLHALDVVVAATGFHAAEAGASFPVHGLGGRELNEVWRGGTHAEAYLGSTVSGFPNFFMMVGPNTALGHNSMIYMIESQARYVLGGVQAVLARPGAALDLLPEIQRDYNRALQARMAGTVWNTGGCSSWYRGADGLNTTLWPDFTFVFRHRTRRFDVENYRWLS